MKKILLVILLCLLTLAGCSADPYADVSNADDAVISVDDTTYTKGQFYDAMISSDSATLVANKLVSMIYENIIGDDSDLIAQADETLANFKTATGDYFLLYLSYYGYSSEETYYKDMVLYLKQDAIAQQYIDDNYDVLVTEYQPKMVRILQTSSSDDANTALAAIKAGADFAETTATYGNGNFTGVEQLIYSTSADVSANVLTAINSYSEPGIMDAVVVNEEGTLYNVIEVTNTDASTFKDTFSSTLLNDLDITTTAITYYVRQGNFTVYDVDVYNALETANPDYLDQ